MNRNLWLFLGVGVLYGATGFMLSWNVSLNILVIGLLSAIMALGVNMQWGYAGLFSTGIVGSIALGGLAVVFVAGAPVPQGFAAGGWRLIFALLVAVGIIAAAVAAWKYMARGRWRNLAVAAILIGGFFLYRALYDPAAAGIEGFNPATFGNIGGFGMNSILAWPVGGLLAAIAAWAIGKIALGLRSDYLAIATLGIAEIVITAMKSEDWMARGVKNFINLPRPWPVPYEVYMQADPAFLAFCANWGLNPITASTIAVKLIYIDVLGRSAGADLAVGAGAELALGPDDAGDP